MSQDRIDREAADWFARLRAERDAGTRARERAAFEAWRAADPRHAEAYDQTEKLWTAAAGLRRRAPAPRQSIGWGWPALTAASLAIVFAVGLLLWQPARQAPTQLIAFEARDARAQQLADGSTVLLAPGAIIDPAFTGATRTLRLVQGEARFIVAHDPARPFIVEAGGTKVRALGTVFDVRTGGTAPIVALIDGRIEVRRGTAAPVTLAKGEAIDAEGARAQAQIPERWAPARITVEGMALREVIALANRGQSRKIDLADPALGTRTVTGSFALDDLDSLARKLAAALDLSLERRGDRLILGPHRPQK